MSAKFRLPIILKNLQKMQRFEPEIFNKLSITIANAMFSVESVRYEFVSRVQVINDRISIARVASRKDHDFEKFR